MRGRGVGAIQLVPAPAGGFANTGGLFAFMGAGLTVTQNLTNVDQEVNFDFTSAGSFGSIARAGNDFTVGANGTYVFIFEPQVRQLKNNNVSSFWVTRNGVAVPGTGADYEAAAIGDSNVVSLTMAGVLTLGDVVQLHAMTSQSVGSDLEATAAAPPKPSVLAVNLVILGFKAF